MSHIKRIAIIVSLMGAIAFSAAEAKVPKNCILEATWRARGAYNLGCVVEGDVCFVRHSVGGDEDAINAEAKKYKAIIIDGFCPSQCAVVADQFRDKVWITARATFGFHQTQIWEERKIHGRRYLCDTGERQAGGYTPMIQAWIDAQDGEPANGLLLMGNKTAQKFWRVYES